MSSSNKSRRSINESNNEELNEKIYQKYLEINKKIIQYSNQFKENFESISQNDKILYENIVAKEKIHLEALKKRIDSNDDYKIIGFEKTDLFKVTRLFNNEIKEQFLSLQN
jgi:hypothetical protein